MRNKSALSILVLERPGPNPVTLHEQLSATALSAQVCTRATLAAGLEAVAAGCFDAVLVDVRLVSCDHTRAVEAILNADPDAAIIMVTPDANPTPHLAALQCGGQDYLCRTTITPGLLERSILYAIERQRVSSMIREEERFARSVIDSLTSHVAVLDQTGVIISVNRAWREFANANHLHSSNCCIGENYLAVCDKTSGLDREDALIVAKGIREVLAGRKPFFYLEYGCDAPPPIAEKHTFSIRVSPIRGSGTAAALVCHQDITREVLAMQLEKERATVQEAMTGMERVLAVVSHELRTPLASVRAIAEMLLDSALAPSDQRTTMLGTLHDASLHMGRVIENMLEVARHNAGLVRWNFKTDVELAAIAAAARQLVLPVVGDKPLHLRVQVSSLLRMNCDPDAIHRLMVNLLANAIRHTDEGFVSLDATSVQNAGGRWVDIIVRDTGCGMSEKKIARLGAPFLLTSAATGDAHSGGTGLGLPICRAIAIAHGGAVTFTSAVGKGTTVHVRLNADQHSAPSTSPMFCPTTTEIESDLVRGGGS